MGRKLRWSLLALILLLAGAQLVPVRRTNPPVQTEIDAPDEVMEILRRSCYSCHSNETRWPWYAHVAPMSWLVIRHVNHGRADLNFSEWPVFDPEAQGLSLHDIEEEIEEGEMPLRSYLLMHPEARLDEGERKVLLDWAGRR